MIKAFEEDNKMYGMFCFDFYDADTGEFLETLGPFKNQLTNPNVNYRNALLLGTFASEGYTVNDLEIMHIALGDGTNQALRTDTQLQNERIRRQVTVKRLSGDDVETIVVFTATEGNFRIREVGVFCGSSSSASPNTGLMLSRINVDVTKTQNVAMNVRRIDRTVI